MEWLFFAVKIGVIFSLAKGYVKKSTVTTKGKIDDSFGWRYFGTYWVFRQSLFEVLWNLLGVQKLCILLLISCSLPFISTAVVPLFLFITKHAAANIDTNYNTDRNVCMIGHIQ
jgi:hypothetical protein